MDVRVSFRMRGRTERYLTKTIQLAAVPSPGHYFQYENGWGLCQVATSDFLGMNVMITDKSVEIDGYGPQFDDDEIKSLIALGWTLT